MPSMTMIQYALEKEFKEFDKDNKRGIQQQQLDC